MNKKTVQMILGRLIVADLSTLIMCNAALYRRLVSSLKLTVMRLHNVSEATTAVAIHLAGVMLRTVKVPPALVGLLGGKA